jgi:hypothetical protein
LMLLDTKGDIWISRVTSTSSSTSTGVILTRLSV